MLKLFGLTIFLGAALLFLLEPLAGKLYLPLLGGSPAVWNTCVMFFQAVLLLGYLYAHLISRLSARTQAIVHLCVLAAALLTLPVRGTDAVPDIDQPALWLSWRLLLTFGPAFFAVAASGPLLQKWFSRTDHPASKDPYFLYGASNAGSAVGLLVYPLLVEPALTRGAQARWWMLAYGGLVLLVGVCGWLGATRGASVARKSDTPEESTSSGRLVAELPITWKRRGIWIAYAAVPSSLMLGATQHITTDIAAVPLLWIVPLTLYLVSYIVAFSPRIRANSRLWGSLLLGPVLLLLFLKLANVRGELISIPLHLVTFFFAATMCHRRLAETRPSAARLTEFYLLISVGGVIGGAFNALLAPVIFSTIVEYPLMLGLACVMRPGATAFRSQPDAARVASGAAEKVTPLRLGIELAIAAFLTLVTIYLSRIGVAGKIGGTTATVVITAFVPAFVCGLGLFRGGNLRFGLCILFLLVTAQFIGYRDSSLLRDRSFFGVANVLVSPGGTIHTLSHGTTTHGMQFRRVDNDPELDRLSRVPTSYYHRTGPVGDLVAHLKNEGRFRRVACIGLGTGTMAAHADAGTEMTFVEIDPLMVSIATNPKYFTYFTDANERGAQVGTWVGDGRLGIAAMPAGSLDLIVLDAFSSDAIPAHLMTSEALQTYAERLAPGGIVTFHISSRAFNLAPVIAAISQDRGLKAYIRRDSRPDPNPESKEASDWIAVVRDDDDLLPLIMGGSWEPLTAGKNDPIWTDEYTAVMKAIEWSRMAPR